MSTSQNPPAKGPARRQGAKLSSTQAQARLAEALRENLRRRKAQLRARDATNNTDDGDTDLPASETKIR